jgi:hypothetical protein
MSNAKGRVAEAYTGSPSSKKTDVFFNYSARGEVVDTWESTPNSGGYYGSAASYWANGLINVLTTGGQAGLPSWTFSPEGEGRVYSIVTNTSSPLVSNATYGIWGLTNVTYGSGDSDVFTLDRNTGRETGYTFNVNGSAVVTGTPSWNANGTLAGLQITDTYNGINTQTCTNTYDFVMRLVANNCGSTWSQSFSYDAFGNIATSGSQTFLPTYTPSTNRYATIPGVTPTYDGNGNLTYDGFHHYTFDAEGNVTQVDSLRVTYDALGRWVERFNGSTYSQAWYTPTGDLLATMLGQSLASAYIHLPGGGIAYYSPSGLYSY